VWFGAVLRGDIGRIRVGARSNIQDLACLHLTEGLSETVVGADVTVGHGAILHGCRVGDRCLIGLGSIVLDNAVIGEGSVIAAGTLVPPRLVVPPGSLVPGSAALRGRGARLPGRAGQPGSRRRPEGLSMKLEVNGEGREVPEGTTVRRLVELLGLADGPVAVERNGEVVRRAQHATELVAEGDVIEIVHFVGGG
jgi:thiamine biosynthesis protein ThiS